MACESLEQEWANQGSPPSRGSPLSPLHLQHLPSAVTVRYAAQCRDVRRQQQHEPGGHGRQRWRRRRRYCRSQPLVGTDGLHEQRAGEEPPASTWETTASCFLPVLLTVSSIAGRRQQPDPGAAGGNRHADTRGRCKRCKEKLYMLLYYYYMQICFNMCPAAMSDLCLCQISRCIIQQKCIRFFFSVSVLWNTSCIISMFGNYWFHSNFLLFFIRISADLGYVDEIIATKKWGRREALQALYVLSPLKNGTKAEKQRRWAAAPAVREPRLDGVNHFVNHWKHFTSKLNHLTAQKGLWIQPNEERNFSFPFLKWKTKTQRL